MSRDNRSSALATVVMCCSLVGVTANAIAQTLSASSTEQIAFDRPEAWAMKYFTSATSLSGLSTPDRLNPGSLAIQFESGWLPALSAAQERVGFNGTAFEELNKAPVFLRPRLALGLPHGLTVDRFLDRSDLTREAIAAYILHPGGQKLLAYVEEQLGLCRCDTQFSWDVLGQYGNLSSATILFILHEWLTKKTMKSGDYGLAAAFGPGFSAEVLLLQWH